MTPKGIMDYIGTVNERPFLWIDARTAVLNQVRIEPDSVDVPKGMVPAWRVRCDFLIRDDWKVQCFPWDRSSRSWWGRMWGRISWVLWRGWREPRFEIYPRRDWSGERDDKDD